MLGAELGSVDAKTNQIDTGSPVVLCQRGGQAIDRPSHGTARVLCGAVCQLLGDPTEDAHTSALVMGRGRGEVWCHDSQTVASGPSHQHRLGACWECTLSAQPRRPESEPVGLGTGVRVLRSRAEDVRSAHVGEPSAAAAGAVPSAPYRLVRASPARVGC